MWTADDFAELMQAGAALAPVRLKQLARALYDAESFDDAASYGLQHDALDRHFFLKLGLSHYHDEWDNRIQYDPEF